MSDSVTALIPIRRILLVGAIVTIIFAAIAFALYFWLKPPSRPDSGGLKPSLASGNPPANIQHKQSTTVCPNEAPGKIIYSPDPDYPIEALPKKLSGKVVVTCEFNAKGECQRVTVYRSDNEVFNAAALKAASQCKLAWSVPPESASTRLEMNVIYTFTP